MQRNGALEQRVRALELCLKNQHQYNESMMQRMCETRRSLLDRTVSNSDTIFRPFRRDLRAAQQRRWRAARSARGATGADQRAGHPAGQQRSVRQGYVRGELAAGRSARAATDVQHTAAPAPSADLKSVSNPPTPKMWRLFLSVFACLCVCVRVRMIACVRPYHTHVYTLHSHHVSKFARCCKIYRLSSTIVCFVILLLVISTNCERDSVCVCVYEFK